MRCIHICWPPYVPLRNIAIGPPLVKKGGPECFLWGLGNQAHELGDDEAAAGADDVAEEGHEDAHGDQGGGAGPGEHWDGGGDADVCQGGHGAAE